MPKASASKPLWGPIPRAELRQYDHPRWNWARRRRVRRALIAVYLLTLAALATVGSLWVVPFVVILVEQAILEKATRGLFRLRARELDERQRAMRDLGYRYGFQILAGAVTALLAAALYLPTDRLLAGTNRLEWMAIALAFVYLVWMVPTLVVAWLEPDEPALDEEAEPPAPAT